jgi:hypothetical protein
VTGDQVVESLPAPPLYFPLRHGRYDIAPGLNRFGKDLDGGEFDRYLFQIDRTYPGFLTAKLASRAEDFGKYVVAHDLAPATLEAINDFIIVRLAAEHPHLAAHFNAAATRGFDRFDALACQVQEDLAIVSTAPDRGHWLSAAHICFPNGWAPAEKVGHSFAAVHEPVAGMADMNRRGEEFVNIMTRATDGLVRFAWGVAFDDRLNHHPDKPRTPFDPANPKAFLRVERQTIWGFPARGAALFTIRTYLYDLNDLRGDLATRDSLVAALLSMSPESRAYKGLAGHFDPLVQWLSQ